MKNKKFFSAVKPKALARILCAAVCMIILLLSPSTALSGAAYGLALWYRTLFPTLLPFMVLSNFIVYTGCARPIGSLLWPVTRLLRLPQSAGYCMLTGFLCGYPMGAYVCGSLNETGELPDDTAAFLAPVCNNVSPMFMISYISMSCLGSKEYSGLVIAVLMGSAFIGMFILRWLMYVHGRMKKPKSVETKKHFEVKKIEKKKIEDKLAAQSFSLSTSEALVRSVDSALMAGLKLCVYVMLFSIVGAMIDALPFFDDMTKAALMSLMEITAGLDKTAKLDISLDLKLGMMLVFTAFGGMSSVLQTMSLWAGARFQAGKYIFLKLGIMLTTAAAVLLLIVIGIL